jgi:hypothetical protein
VIIPVFAAIGGFLWLAGRGVPIPAAIVVSLCGGAILSGMLLLGSGTRLEYLQKALIEAPARIVAIIAALWGLYLIYAIGTGAAHFQPLTAMALYVSLPFLLLSGARGRVSGTWQDAVTILWMWLPLELGIMRRLLITSASNTDFHYAFAQGLAINTAILAFAGWRRVPGIGYRFEFDRKIVSVGLTSFLLFAVIAIPLGLAIHFIGYSFEMRKLLIAPAAFIGIFLFTAIPEEFLFRGIIQNWFDRVTGRRGLSLIFASVVFGASHLNNGPPIPNYKYFLMASIAGIFYGLVWQRTGSVTASAITHALVDTTWSAFFR